LKRRIISVLLDSPCFSALDLPPMAVTSFQISWWSVGHDSIFGAVANVPWPLAPLGWVVWAYRHQHLGPMSPSFPHRCPVRGWVDKKSAGSTEQALPHPPGVIH